MLVLCHDLCQPSETHVCKFELCIFFWKVNDNVCDEIAVERLWYGRLEKIHGCHFRTYGYLWNRLDWIGSHPDSVFRLNAGGHGPFKYGTLCL